MRFLLALCYACCVASAPAATAAQVQLELIVQQRAPITSQHDWLQQLGKAGVESLRIRQAAPGDKPGIEVRGTAAAPVYFVTGVLDSSGDVIVESRRYRLGEAPLLAKWLRQVGPKGTAPARSEERGAFGLSAAQFEGTKKALSPPLGFATAGVARSEVLRKAAALLGPKLRSPLPEIPAEEDDKLTEDLSGLSTGTALACALRPAGYCLAPKAGAAGVEYSIVAAAPGVEPWPIGWPAEKPEPEVLPALFEPFNANLKDVPLPRLLEALSQRLKTPILWDHNALARHGVEPAKTLVTHSGRVTYLSLLRRALGQAKCRCELRVDESGTPLLWLTTAKPM